MDPLHQNVLNQSSSLPSLFPPFSFHPPAFAPEVPLSHYLGKGERGAGCGEERVFAMRRCVDATADTAECFNGWR